MTSPLRVRLIYFNKKQRTGKAFAPKEGSRPQRWRRQSRGRRPCLGIPLGRRAQPVSPGTRAAHPLKLLTAPLGSELSLAKTYKGKKTKVGEGTEFWCPGSPHPSVPAALRNKAPARGGHPAQHSLSHSPQAEGPDGKANSSLHSGAHLEPGTSTETSPSLATEQMRETESRVESERDLQTGN